MAPAEVKERDEDDEFGGNSGLDDVCLKDNQAPAGPLSTTHALRTATEAKDVADTSRRSSWARRWQEPEASLLQCEALQPNSKAASGPINQGNFYSPRSIAFFSFLISRSATFRSPPR